MTLNQIKEIERCFKKNFISKNRYNPLDDYIKINPFMDGVTANKASKISRLLGYKYGTIHKVENNKFHPCIDHEDFLIKYFLELKKKMYVLNENNKIVVEF